MKEYTIILDDVELDVLMTILEDTLLGFVSSIEDATLEGVLKQIQIQRDNNKRDYE